MMFTQQPPNQPLSPHQPSLHHSLLYHHSSVSPHFSPQPYGHHSHLSQLTPPPPQSFFQQQQQQQRQRQLNGLVARTGDRIEIKSLPPQIVEPPRTHDKSHSTNNKNFNKSEKGGDKTTKTNRTDSSSSNLSKKLTPCKRSVERISRACDFCKKRHLKCDGTLPTCGFCVKHLKTCNYSSPKKRGPRPKIQNEPDNDEVGSSSSPCSSPPPSFVSSIPPSSTNSTASPPIRSTTTDLATSGSSSSSSCLTSSSKFLEPSKTTSSTSTSTFTSPSPSSAKNQTQPTPIPSFPQPLSPLPSPSAFSPYIKNPASPSPSPNPYSFPSSPLPSGTVSSTPNILSSVPSRSSTPSSSSFDLVGDSVYLIQQLLAFNSRLLVECEQKQQHVEELEEKCAFLEKKTHQQQNLIEELQGRTAGPRITFISVEEDQLPTSSSPSSSTISYEKKEEEKYEPTPADSQAIVISTSSSSSHFLKESTSTKKLAGKFFHNLSSRGFPHSPPNISIINDPFSLVAVGNNWLEHFYLKMQFLWSELELPSPDLVQAALLDDEEIPLSKRFGTMAMLAMGSSITGHHQFSNDFLRRCTRMVDLTILSFKDMDLVYGLLILCKLFFHHLELEKSAYYSNLAIRLRNVPKSTKLQIQMISEGLASMKDPHDREYLLKKALAHKPRGYELVLLYMHFLRNEVCRGVKPTDNLLNSSQVMQSYLDEADVTIDSCEIPSNPINVRWSLTLRLIVLGYRAAIHSRIQEKEQAIAEANKVTNVLSSPHLVDMNNLYLGDIFGLCFAAMVYLKYKEHDMLDKVIHILRINGSRLPLAEHAADCAERVKESGVEIDDRMGALTYIPEFNRYWCSTSADPSDQPPNYVPPSFTPTHPYYTSSLYSSSSSSSTSSSSSGSSSNPSSYSSHSPSLSSSYASPLPSVSVVSSVFAPPERAASPLPLPLPFSTSQEDSQIGAGDDHLGLLGYEAFERFLMDPVTSYDTYHSPL